jgi:PAS domain S-box-containing protein
MDEPDLRDARILIVDDQEANALFLEGLLQEGGYRHWRSVRDPRAAAAACADYRPDLVLLDLIMPNLDGFGVLELLRPVLAEEAYLPVLVLTVDISPESKRRALAAGAKDFLSKPLDAVEVLLRVKNLLETRFLYRQLQRRADERIREQAALIDQTNDAVLVCDLDDRVTFWNRGAEVIYGWTAAEVMGRDASKLLGLVAGPELEEAHQALTATGKWTGELPQVTREGRGVVVASRWTLLYDPEGRPRSKLVINTDITETKKTEQKLLRAQRMENIGRLAGGIAHDLNNILAPLIMGVDLLEVAPVDASSRDLLATMRTSLKRGADLVRQILSFSRGLDKRQPVRLAALVGELARLYQGTFPKSITIRTSVPDDLWAVHADATQLHQVLTNLSVNARDAMPHGGQLRITARNLQMDRPEPNLAQELTPGPYVLLEVEDTGAGIRPDLVARIFDPFFTTKEVGKGTGLGLSTSQGIIRNHGGCMRVESEVGKGSRFLVYLPAHGAADPGPAEPERGESPGGNGELVLVVDDEAALLQIAKLTLTNAGYQVLTARDGAEALALYAQRWRDIQLVLTDLVMPGLDGVATIQGMRRLNPAARVILVSGMLAADETAQATGVRAYLPKPYTVEALLSTVRSVLDAS